MSDITLQAIDVRALPVNEGDEHATLAIATAIMLPFGTPDGQQAMAQADVYRVHMSKPGLKVLLDSLQESYDALPDPKPQSNLVVPGSMQDADRVAQELGKLR